MQVSRSGSTEPALVEIVVEKAAPVLRRDDEGEKLAIERVGGEVEMIMPLDHVLPAVGRGRRRAQAPDVLRNPARLGKREQGLADGRLRVEPRRGGEDEGRPLGLVR